MPPEVWGDRSTGRAPLRTARSASLRQRESRYSRRCGNAFAPSRRLKIVASGWSTAELNPGRPGQHGPLASEGEAGIVIVPCRRDAGREPISEPSSGIPAFCASLPNFVASSGGWPCPGEVIDQYGTVIVGILGSSALRPCRRCCRSTARSWSLSRA